MSDIPEPYIYFATFDYPLISTAAIVMIIGIGILYQAIGLRLAVFVMFVKIAIALSYFVWFADGGWFVGGDDYAYFFRAADLNSLNAGLWDIWFHPSMRYYLEEQHSIALTIVLNYVSVNLFGTHYYAQVFVNILLTTVSAVFFAGILRAINNRREYVLIGTVFFVLHWTTIVWSSFLNLKEPTVVCLLLGTVYFVITRERAFAIKLVGATAMCFLFTLVRFYYPLFIFGGLFGAYLTGKPRLSVVFGVLLLCIFGAWVLSDEVRFFLRYSDFASTPYTLVHFLLQPAPWKITDPASYLLIPSMLHWIWVIPTLVGAVLLWSIGWRGRLILAIVVSGVAFYSIVPMIASTRHRAPLDALLIICQFHCIYAAVTGISSELKRSIFSGVPDREATAKN